MSNAHSGIQVPDERFDMFYSRLVKRVRKLGLNNFSSIVIIWLITMPMNLQISLMQLPQI